MAVSDTRSQTPLPTLWTAQSRVRVRTLILLRWLAIFGQTVSVLFVRYGLDVDFPIGWALAAIAVSVALNLGLIATRRAQELALEWEAAAQLAYDVIQLAVLLALTGGLQNPFVFLFVAPVAVSATVLRPAVTAMLAAITFVCVGAISVLRLPLPWPDDATFSLPPLYQMGIAAAVLVGLGFTSVYAWRVAAEEERLNIALAAAQAVLAREQTLSALGGLAAAAAHELGTPLATIHLVAKEMARGIPADDPRFEDLQLLVTQSERCRAILAQLSANREQSDIMLQRAPIRVMLEEVIAPHEGLGADIIIDAQGDGPLEVRRMPEIIHSLGGIVENAVGFANTRVDIEARWDANQVAITVRDDGPGFAPGVLNRLGEPYLTERDREGVAGGLGLGFFISKTLLERTGAKLEMRNRRPPNPGAVVKVTWPRPSIEAPAL
ncbi:ActS/PrrB/RegB family redox-sensitive histidine kinase [Terricaulis silvestris]|uniref:histidine kinase n=1 Tax=Terricaulis silvestris TaxID=2686094 RepID=A0A6I6MS01_9CAUL|nr:ActS/PrrB/RegB family redox-sensitive histidine kinase [Terricaulis silvestris]QGZ95394.1 Sensor histidine kinase RegB [Terricaulis silvestris]